MKTRVGVLLALALSACGGGSGGSGGIATPTTYDLQAGYAGFVMNGETSTVTLSGNVISNGVSTPFTGTGTLTVSPATSATFNGTTAQAQVVGISGTLAAAGQSIPYSSTVTDYYGAGTVTFLGENSQAEFDVASTPLSYPTSLVGGATGTLGTLSRYTDNTMAISLGTVQLSYDAIAPATAGGPLTVNITTKTYDTQNALVETDVTTYSLASSNTMTLVKGTIQSASGNLTVTAP
jgi:hypothetical protein